MKKMRLFACIMKYMEIPFFRPYPNVSLDELICHVL